MDTGDGILFAQKDSRRAPFLATAVPVAKLGAMTVSAIRRLQQLLATPKLPERGPKPRANVQTEVTLNANLDSLFRETRFPLPQQQLIRSLVLLWHDHLDAAHTIAQAIETPDGSFVHAIMHRREPDYFNAKYWWRRVGKHPAFPEIARRVDELLTRSRRREEADSQEVCKVRLLTSAATSGDLVNRLLPGGTWNPDAFVDACEQAATGGSPQQTELLREIQRVETEVLLDRFAAVE